MKGALVFLAVFAIVLVATISYVNIPPGKMIYDAILPGTETYTADYPMFGIDAFHIIVGVFNGVIYGFIAWLIFTLLMTGKKKEKPQNIQQVVNVNVGDKKDNTPPPPPQ
jgi:hypothetical protein